MGRSTRVLNYGRISFPALFSILEKDSIHSRAALGRIKPRYSSQV